VIVLNERLVNASISKLFCVPGFHQETALISEYLRLGNDHARQIGGKQISREQSFLEDTQQISPVTSFFIRLC
jgi:hypothetical protein